MFRDTTKEPVDSEVDEDVRELNWYIRSSKLIKFNVLGYFHKILLEFKGLIDDELKEQEKKKKS